MQKSVSLTIIFLLFAPFFLLSQKIDTLAKVSNQMDIISEKVETLISLVKKDKNASSPFKVSIGASFDFLSGSRPADLYYDVNFFIPQIWEGDKKSFWKKVGLDAAFYQTRLLGDSVEMRFPQPPKSFAEIPPDSLRLESYTLVRKEKITFNDTGIFIDPTIKLKKNLYVAIHLEGIIQEKITFLNDSFIEIDSTLRIHKNDYEPMDDLRHIKEGEKPPSKTDIYRTLIGGSFLLYFTYQDVTFRVKPAIGWLRIRDESKYTPDRISDIGFCNINIQLIDNKGGIKLGGEIRNFWKNQSLRSPSYSIFLSKQFSVKKLGEFISSK